MQTQPQNTAPTTAYFGLATAVQKWGAGINKDHIRDLNWQRTVGGKRTKISQFQEVAGSLQELKAYLFIKKGSIFTTIVHSPMKFVGIKDATQHLQGQIIGFLGNRTTTREPTPILLPLQKTW
jgi:hypothetical protein